jgi:hypothetical protein
VSAREQEETKAAVLNAALRQGANMVQVSLNLYTPQPGNKRTVPDLSMRGMDLPTKQVMAAQSGQGLKEAAALLDQQTVQGAPPILSQCAEPPPVLHKSITSKEHQAKVHCRLAQWCEAASQRTLQIVRAHNVVTRSLFLSGGSRGGGLLGRARR